MASAVMYTGVGTGGFIAAPLLNRAIAAAGGNWRVGWWVVAALAVGSTSVAALFVRNHPSDLGQLPDGGYEPAVTRADSGFSSRKVYKTTEEWSFAEALRTPAFWWLTISAVGISVGYVTFMAHGVVHLEGLGHSPSAAAMSMSVMAISLLVGKLAGGLGDVVEPRYIWALAMVSFALGLILVVKTTGVGVYPVAALMGIGWGAALVCIMTMPINYFGRKAYPSIIALMLAVQITIGAAAPIVAGYIYDVHKTYAVAFYSAAALCLVGCVVLLKATPPIRKPVAGLFVSEPALDPAARV